MFWVELHCDMGLEFNPDNCVNYYHKYPMGGFPDLRKVRSVLLKEAKQTGWLITDDGLAICPSCKRKLAKEKTNGQR